MDHQVFGAAAGSVVPADVGLRRKLVHYFERVGRTGLDASLRSADSTLLVVVRRLTHMSHFVDFFVCGFQMVRWGMCGQGLYTGLASDTFFSIYHPDIAIGGTDVRSTGGQFFTHNGSGQRRQTLMISSGYSARTAL